MHTINIHEAKTHLSRLIEQAAQGESFIIAKAGKPLVKVIALDTSTAIDTKKIGFMAGQFTVPTDFDHLEREEIEQLFGSEG